VARFLIISINYAPEPTGFAPHATAMAEYLAGRGHGVSVFTGFPFAPEWKRSSEYRGRLVSTEQIGGVAVHRVTHFIPRRPSSPLQRAAMEGSFSAAAFAAMAPSLVARNTRPDVVLYIGAQPSIAMLARLVGGLTRRPYFVNINDLAARAASDVGLVSGPIYRILDAFEFAAYRGAAGASVLCRGFERALVDHGYPGDRIRVIRSPIDLDQIRPIAPTGAFRAQYGIPADAFVVIHAGSMGRKQGLMNVLDAAGRTLFQKVYWLMVGDGEVRNELLAATRARGLDETMRFVPFQETGAMAAMFATANVLLLNQVSAGQDTVVPSKLLTYMAAGRPVIAAVNATSQAAEIMDEANGGWLIAPEDPAALADAVSHVMAMDHADLAAYGARNRAYAEAHFDQRTVLAAHEQFMLSTTPVRASSKPAA
jgi:glycosyltransferase involved in cell wall biosynthesis